MTPSTPTPPPMAVNGCPGSAWRMSTTYPPCWRCMGSMQRFPPPWQPCKTTTMQASAGCACTLHRTPKRPAPQRCIVSSRPLAHPEQSMKRPIRSELSCFSCLRADPMRGRHHRKFPLLLFKWLQKLKKKQCMDAIRVMSDMQPSIAAACTSRSQIHRRAQAMADGGC